MIDDVYLAALAAIEHHLKEAGADYSLDDGELNFNGHRLGIAIAFEGFVQQSGQTLAPLDIQIHLDGDSGDRFRVGTLGVGRDPAAAVKDAIGEWQLLAVAPLLSALGAGVEKRRGGAVQKLGGWDLFPGSVGLRGQVPGDLRPGGDFYRALVERLRLVVAEWQTPDRFTLRTLALMATCGPREREVQAAIDGLLDVELTAIVDALPWPKGDDAYLYKQLLVLRHEGSR